MHRRPDLWGEDVLEFRPERWEEERRGSKWQFLPFSGGMYFFLLSPPNRMKYAYAYSHRSDQDMTSGTFSFFLTHFFFFFISPTYLPTYLLTPPFFLPSLGPRVCLGQQFALVEASYVIIRILQTFDAIVPGDVMEMSRLRKGLGLTLWPRDGVPVKFHRAD